MSIRLKTKKLIYAGLIGALIATLIWVAAGYFIYGKEQDKKNNLTESYRQNLAELQRVADANSTVYVLNTDIDKGTPLTEDMLVPVYVPEGAVPEDSIQLPELKFEEDYMYFAKTDIPANTQANKSLFYYKTNITSDVREAEYGFIEIPTNVKKDSYVDIRIQFPTGDEFIVLSKKHIKDVKGIKTWMNVREDESLTMSSAIVDAYIEGAKIYALPYVDEHMQDASIMTYPVKENVKQLIDESPNVLTIAQNKLTELNRIRLEENLLSLTPETKEKIQSGKAETNANIEASNSKLSEEDRLSEMSEQAETQSDLIGGDQ